jgi:hypothetical protein
VSAAEVRLMSAGQRFSVSNARRSRRGRAAPVASLFGCRTPGHLSGAAGERSCRGPVLDVAQAIRNPTRT